MKLIKKLSPKKDNNGNWQSYAIFKCPECLQEVERRLCNGIRSKSCGCTQYTKNIRSYKHGGSFTKLYDIWVSMKQRVLNSKSESYKDYGGRGISICPEWTNDYITFRDWALNNDYQEGLIFDRKNPNGNYEPNNCRFITMRESNRNKRNTITMQIANEIRKLWNTGKYLQKELAEKFDLSYSQICGIINNRFWS